MSNYEKNETGVLFKNDKKEKETQPDYKGNLTVDNVEYYISSWINTSKKGDKYMSLKLTKKEDVKDEFVKEVSATLDDGMDQSIPF